MLHLSASNNPLHLLVQLIKALEEARGNGTSMISLIMPPKDQVAIVTRCPTDCTDQFCSGASVCEGTTTSNSKACIAVRQVARVQKMLGDEFGTASNIKSRVNRQSVLGAITSAQQRLKLYNKVPQVFSVNVNIRANITMAAGLGISLCHPPVLESQCSSECMLKRVCGSGSSQWFGGVHWYNPDR